LPRVASPNLPPQGGRLAKGCLAKGCLAERLSRQKAVSPKGCLAKRLPRQKAAEGSPPGRLRARVPCRRRACPAEGAVPCRRRECRAERVARAKRGIALRGRSPAVTLARTARRQMGWMQSARASAESACTARDTSRAPESSSTPMARTARFPATHFCATPLCSADRRLCAPHGYTNLSLRSHDLLREERIQAQQNSRRTSPGKTPGIRWKKPRNSPNNAQINGRSLSRIRSLAVRIPQITGSIAGAICGSDHRLIIG
jgi:hypothetical protein